jgi:hypothetical protein
MELGSNNLIVLVQQAMLHQQAGRLVDAETHYHRALAIDPNQFEALHFLAAWPCNGCCRKHSLPPSGSATSCSTASAGRVQLDDRGSPA